LTYLERQKSGPDKLRWEEAEEEAEVEEKNQTNTIYFPSKQLCRTFHNILV
jgi:hypothetical protein